MTADSESTQRKIIYYGLIMNDFTYTLDTIDFHMIMWYFYSLYYYFFDQKCFLRVPRESHGVLSVKHERTDD
jgi:hypothetical protein